MFALVLMLAGLLICEMLIFWQSRAERQLACRLIEANWVSVRQMQEMVAAMLKLSENLANPVLSVEPTAHEDEKFYKRAFNLAQGEGYISASLLRASLGVGYGRAKRLVQHLEKAGAVVSKPDRMGKRSFVAPVASGAFQ